MSVDGADPLRALRERLVVLVRWFAADRNRLREAQLDWRRGSELWRRGVEAEVDRWQLDRAAIRFAPLATATPAQLLRELECLDLDAYLTAGNMLQSPSHVIDGFHVIRLARERAPRTAAQPGVIYTHLRYHAIVPTQIGPFRVRVERMNHGVKRCRAARDRGEIVVATTSFGDAAAIAWTQRDQASTATGVPTAAARADNLIAAIDEAAAREVDVLVAPELTMPPAERARVIDELRWKRSQLALIVPGSFHERVGEHTYNRAVLVDGNGNQLCEHLKLTSFGVLEGGFLEDISLGDAITVLVTPIGTVAIAICKDFCDVHVGKIWEELQPEWLLVPAYGAGAGAHELAAKRIALVVGTVTILAHEGHDEASPPNSFVHDEESLRRRNGCAPGFSEHKISLRNDFS